ncbi:MAG: hypothetical protein MI702_00540 [Chlorobiales bacterium]|nr:hypothetical protein [Chlorobiales bacterium]
MNTTQYKLSNISIESSSIKITDSLSILSSNEATKSFGSVPKDLLYQMSSIQEPYGLNRFLDSLCSSSIVVSCAISDRDMEENPSGVDDCSFCAVALAIMKETYFVAGIEKFINSKGQISWAPWTTCFDGLRGKNLIYIDASEENQLRKIYSFVLTGFTKNLHSSKLLHLFCKCCCLSATDSFHVLKIGLPNFGNSYATRIVNSALLFEMITGKHSARNIERAINTLNVLLNISISEEDVVRIMNYRHIVVHDNASTAKNKIDNWLAQTGKTEKQGYEWVYEKSLLIAKELLRAIALDYSTYQNYKNNT